MENNASYQIHQTNNISKVKWLVDHCDLEGLLAFSSLITILSIAIHTAILRSIFKHCDWLNTRYYILVSLMAGDILISTIPFCILPSLSTSFNTSACIRVLQATDFIMTVGISSSTLSATFLNLHRYIFCLHPFACSRILSCKNILTSLMFIWALCISLSIANSFTTPDDEIVEHSGVFLFGSMALVAVMTIGTCVVIFVQTRLLFVTLKKLTRDYLQRRAIFRVFPGFQHSNMVRIHNRHKCRKMVPAIIVVLTCTSLTLVLPIALLVKTLQPYHEHEAFLETLLDGLPFVITVMNPLVYCLTICEVRQGVKIEICKIISKMSCRRINAVQPDVSEPRRNSRLVSTRENANLESHPQFTAT